ncbi:hypothetical protein L4923_24580, partial [Mesorhizobium sp. IRAMC:0171]|nr:hypothetical protein [Mesorhizobium sp. IRAMC:0171]
MGLDLTGYQPSDDDFADIKLDGGAQIDKLLVNHDGQIFYNPGDGASFNDVLNGSLNGEGNDTAVSLAQVNNMSDDDSIGNASVSNTGIFEQNGDATGGDARSGDGLTAGGGGGGGGGSGHANGGDGGNGH